VYVPFGIDVNVSGPLVIVDPSLLLNVAVAVMTSGIGSGPNVKTLSDAGTPVEPGAGDSSGGPFSASVGQGRPPGGGSVTTTIGDDDPPPPHPADAATAAMTSRSRSTARAEGLIA
jgi:hypothetical protein